MLLGSSEDRQKSCDFFSNLIKILGSPTNFAKGFIRWDEYKEAFDPKYKGEKAGYVMGKSFVDLLLMGYSVSKISESIKLAKMVNTVNTTGLKVAGLVGKEFVEEVGSEAPIIDARQKKFGNGGQ